MITLSSCYTTTYFVKGEYQLKSTSANIETTIFQEGAGVYSDEYVTLRPVWNEFQIDLTIFNNSKSSIRVLWDNAAYIDNYGISHRVIHMNTKFVDKEKAQVPSVIPTGSRIEDVVVPVNAIKNVGGVWVPGPLVDNQYDTQARAEQELNKYKTNPRYSESMLLLPIEVEGKTIEYTITFIGGEFRVESESVYDAATTLTNLYIASGLVTAISLLLPLIAM